MSIEELLRHAVERHASDLHLTVGSVPVLRVNGALIPVSGEVLQSSDTEQMVRTLMPSEQFSQLDASGDVDFSYSLPGISRYRVNVYRQRGCYGAAIRMIPNSIPSFDELGLPGVLLDFIKHPQGLVLVTGPTGHGKSTTLAALINVINNTSARHIVTLEDPIEYLHKHDKSIVNQREIGLDTPTFSLGLRSALRQDPDVIMVGEMRDLDTIHTAISAAETGHLVLATLHTNSAPQTVERIIDVFPVNQQAQIRIQLASVLLGIVSQRLLPLVSGDGRVAVSEVLVNTSAVANLIRTEQVHQLITVMQTSRGEGMHTMRSQMMEYVQRGLISQDNTGL